MRKVVFFCLFLFLFASLAGADTFSALVVYGDSLSDNGNFNNATNMIPSPPYYNGRISNGPVAVEDMATTLGVPLFDFAWVGATTGIGNHLDPGGSATTFGTYGLPGMMAEFASTQSLITPQLAASGLFVVWGGPNDFLSPSPLDASPIDTANRGVENLLALVTGLQALGVEHILVPGMPDLGLTPYFQSQGAQAAAGATAISDYFNAQLVGGLPPGVTFFDTASLLRQIVANPGAYGFTNATDACFTGSSLCGDPNQYLFFDDFHPTAAGHAVLAQQFVQAVPEPASWIFVLCGIIALRKRM